MDRDVLYDLIVKGNIYMKLMMFIAQEGYITPKHDVFIF